jgi:hypothetical protein
MIDVNLVWRVKDNVQCLREDAEIRHKLSYVVENDGPTRVEIYVCLACSVAHME